MKKFACAPLKILTTLSLAALAPAAYGAEYSMVNSGSFAYLFPPNTFFYPDTAGFSVPSAATPQSSEFIRTGPVLEFSSNTGTYLFAGFANAGPGYLKAAANTSVSNGQVEGGSSYYETLASATVSLLIKDVVITGPSASPLLVTMNLDASGTMATIASGSFATANGYASVAAGVGDANGQNLVNVGYGEWRKSKANLTAENETLDGPWDLSQGGLVTSSAFYITPGTPFSIKLFMQVSASSSVWDGYAPSLSQGSTDFSQTFSFPTTGNVFNLPDGYTATSIDGNIDANAFAGIPGDIPEPASLGVLGLGTLALLARRRR